MQVSTAAYGKVTGRVTSVAIDPSDSTGNTVYLGTTGGGVWKSTDAAGTAASVQFAPLTDNLQAYSANAGSSATASISIGALTVQPGGTGVVLAGTGDPNDATDSYYGSGLLRSTDKGVTWTLVPQSDDGVAGKHSFAGEGFAGFAWSASTANLVVAAVSSSAEGAVVGASNVGASVRGLYYSTDAGSTWQMATIQDGTQTVQSASSDFTGYEGNAVTSVVWNPLRKRFYAAVRFHGYYESSDGRTFTRLAVQPGVGLTALACPVRANAAGLSTCPIFRGALAAQPVSGDLFALTVDANNGDTGLYQDVCASTGTACISNTVLWAKKLVSTPLETTSGTILQGDSTLALAAVPAATALSMTDTLLLAGTGDIFRCKLSDANGCALRNTTNATTTCATPAMVAPAQHGIAFQTNTTNTAAPLLFFGNDGGLWRSTDGVNQQAAPCSADDATHFDNLNGALGSLAEVNGLSSHPTDGGIALVALGALGSAASTTSSTTASVQTVWTQMGTGYGGGVAIDQAAPANWFVQSGTGIALHACTKGTSCTAADFAGTAAIGTAQVNSDLALQDAPFLLDPALNTNVLVGTCRIYRGPASGGSAWSSANAISAPLTGPANSTCSDANGLIRSLAAGGATVLTSAAQTSGSPVLYAGLAGANDGGTAAFGGRIFRTSAANLANGATQWTDLSQGTVTNDTANGGRFNPLAYDVSAISVDPQDATGLTVYATIAGFDTPSVYRSTNGGSAWTNVTANLPSAPANAVIVDPNNREVVYVALDTGVYVTTDITACATANAQCWSVYGTALPNAPVTTLVASTAFAVPGSTTSGVLRAGTYGRGIWQLPLITAGQGSVAAATLSPNALSFGSQSTGYTGAAQSVTVTNTGTAALTITRVVASAGWIETDNCAGATLLVNGTCTVRVSFTPAAAGAATGTLNVYGNVLGGYVTASLSGTGAGPATVLLTPANATFADTAVRATSAVTTLTLTNSSGQAVTLQTPVLTGDFKLASNGCGATLAPSANCALTVSFMPSAAGLRTGLLTLADSIGTHTATLSGNGTAGVIAVSPLSIAFPQTVVGQSSVTRSFTVQNTGNGPLQVGAATLTGDFAATADTCSNTTLASAKSCSVTLRFTPVQSGTRSGTLVLPSDSGGSPSSTTVTLTGTTPATFSVVLTPTTLDFGPVSVGSTSAVKNITISNTGTGSGAIGSAVVTGDYVIKANTCGATLAAQTGCTISIAFVPAASGTRAGTFTITDDAGTQAATLTGSGTLAATDALSPLTLTFTQTTVGTSSAAQTVLLSNDGDVALTLVAAKVTSGDFTAVNGCGPSLAAHSSCGIAVSFAPKSVGTLRGTLEVDDVQRAQIVSLSGSAAAGAGVSLSPATLTFAETGVGNATASQTVVLTNNGGAPLQLSAVTTTGDFGLVAGAGTCAAAAVVAVNANCSTQVVFTPTAAGARSGSLTVAGSNAVSQTATLSGTGVDFAFTSNGASSVTVANGRSAVFPLLLTPAATSALPVMFTCIGAPANAKCTVVSTYANLSGTSTVSVTVLTGTTVVRLERWKHATLVLAALLPFGVVGLRRRSASLVSCAALITVAVLLSGCGSARHIAESGTGSGSGDGTAATPTGSYNLIVSASAAGLTRQVPLTLVVTAQ